MLFHTATFLGFFLVTFSVYWALPWHRGRIAWLLAASCFFYMSWNPWLIGLILFSASADYFAALMIERVGSRRLRRGLLIGSIGVNLGLLAFFKYVNFFLDSAHAFLGVVGLESQRRVLDIVLPLGISFYTFETISYIVDVYCGRTQPVRNALDYALYILFFPHLIAGPIVRPREFLPQLGQRKRFNWDRMQLGVQLFLLGLFKKAVIADHLAAVVDPVFKQPGLYGTAAAWLAVVAYAVQIYCDFSGYSDMAVGTAHMLGFKLPRNFNLPYFAASISEFWRRWHISLSTWLRDYVYIPLGGNRHGVAATHRNLILTMLLGGLWHGASWTFVAWGLYHGVLLALHRAMPRPRWMSARLLRPPAVAATFLLVCIGWVLFRAQSFADAAVIMGLMFQPLEGAMLARPHVACAVLMLSLVFAAHLLRTFVDLRKVERRASAFTLGSALALLALLALFLMPDGGKAFIYFQF